jgi:hypothetical protein
MIVTCVKCLRVLFVTWVTSALTNDCVSGAVSLFQHKERALCGNYWGPWGIGLYFLCLELFHCLSISCLCSINWPYLLTLRINFT